jgi:exopolysaccharide biosynthesis polyprenyl glycosylphosphotransferase
MKTTSVIQLFSLLYGGTPGMSISVSNERGQNLYSDNRRQINLETVSRQSGSKALHSIPTLAFGIDLVAIAITILLALIGRDHMGLFAHDASDVAVQVNLAAPIMAVGWLGALAIFGAYESRFFGAGTDEYRRATSGTLVALGLTGVGCYLMQFHLSRGFFVLTALIGVLLVIAGRWLLRNAIKSARRNGSLLRRVLIVGSSSHVDDVARVLKREDWLGYDVVGALVPDATPTTPTGVPVLGDAAQVVTTANEVAADVVFFAGGAVSSATHMRQVAWDLEHSDTQIVVAPSLTDVSRERIHVRPVGGLPLIHLEKPKSAAAMRRAKRTFDIVGSSVLLLLSAPVFLFAAAQIRFNDRGPVFFKQERIGQGAKPFRCWKFRTMVINADDLLAELHREQGTDNGVFSKVKADPRVTKPGRWLRRLSLDELPQVINVLRGDMSLVGPRPQVAREVALYDSAMSRRLHVRPGMTGLWQVSGRSDLSLEEAIRLDLYYVDNWSMLRDLSILARTWGAVLGCRGAY